MSEESYPKYKCIYDLDLSIDDRIKHIESENEKIRSWKVHDFLNGKTILFIITMSMLVMTGSYLVLISDETYLGAIEAAASLKDTYALEQIRNEVLSPIENLVIILGVSYALAYICSYIHKTSAIKHNEKVLFELKEEPKSNDHNEGYINDSFYSTEGQECRFIDLKLSIMFWISFLVINAMMMISFSKDNEVKEVKVDGVISSIHYNDAANQKFTLFYEDEGYLKKIRIPSQLAENIKISDSPDTKPEFSLYYRSHGENSLLSSQDLNPYSLPIVISSDKRSVDYFFNVTLPKGYQIQGTKTH